MIYNFPKLKLKQKSSSGSFSHWCLSFGGHYSRLLTQIPDWGNSRREQSISGQSITFTNTQPCTYTNTQVCKYTNLKVRRYTNTKVCKYTNTKVLIDTITNALIPIFRSFRSRSPVCKMFFFIGKFVLLICFEYSSVTRSSILYHIHYPGMEALFIFFFVF